MITGNSLQILPDIKVPKNKALKFIGDLLRDQVEVMGIGIVEHL